MVENDWKIKKAEMVKKIVIGKYKNLIGKSYKIITKSYKFLVSFYIILAFAIFPVCFYMFLAINSKQNNSNVDPGKISAR